MIMSRRGVYCEGVKRRHCTMNYITWESFGFETLANPLYLFGVVLELGVDFAHSKTLRQQWILPREKVIIVSAHVGIVPIQRVMDDGNRGWYRVAHSTLRNMKKSEVTQISPLRERLDQIELYKRSAGEAKQE